jgi:hypothetical protein
MRRMLAALAVSVLFLAGCGGSQEPMPVGDAPAIEIQIAGDDVQPRGERIEVGVGEEVVLAVESDRAAEMHVHSSPEQVLEVPVGESTLG